MSLQAQPVDPALEQRVTIDEPVIVDESVIINQGHVDLRLYLDESGQLQFYARDDAFISPVWRPTEDVIRGGGGGRDRASDDANYNFIGAAPGDTVSGGTPNRDPGGSLGGLEYPIADYC